MLAAEVARQLDREADAVRGQAAHYAEQGDKQAACTYLQIEYGLRLVAHVIAATAEEDDE